MQGAEVTVYCCVFDKSSWNFIPESFLDSCQAISIFVFVGQKLLHVMTYLCFVGNLYLNSHLHLCSMPILCMYTFSVTSWTHVKVGKIKLFFL